MGEDRAVFLDRDGVINEAPVSAGKPGSPATLAELRILPGVREALQQLRSAGLATIVVTNQPDVAKGILRREDVEAIHEHLLKDLALDAVRVCYHVDEDGCECRKPRPGMILDAARDYGIDPTRSFLVGDRWRDIDAGRAAGCKTWWIDRGYSAEPEPERPDARVASLLEAAQQILAALRA